MNKDSIIQFAGFATQLSREVFTDQWIQYAKALANNAGAAKLHEKTEGNAKFNYLSMHEFGEQDFSFSFVKGRVSENFPDQKARVSMLGGYSPADSSTRSSGEKTDIKVFAFITQEIVDVDAYSHLPQARHTNIYLPFYENCLYSLIVEFSVAEKAKPELITELRSRKENLEIAAYRPCKVPHSIA